MRSRCTSRWSCGFNCHRLVLGFRQRSEGRLFSFVPHSMAAGGLIAPKDSNIVDDIDLKNKKIGIAGGQVDKGWLIFRAFYKKNTVKTL